MATFRLRPGGAAKINGRYLQPGDTVEHDADLTKLFPNRFDLISGTPDAPEDDEPRALSASTPFDVASTRRHHPLGGPQATEEAIPENEEPVLRPAGAIRGGDQPPGAVPAEDEEAPVSDGEEEVSDEEPAPEAPAPRRRAAAPKPAAKPAAHGQSASRRH